MIPLALAWANAPASVWRGRRAAEGALTLAAVAGLSLIAFSADQPLTYIVFPAFIWAALRFGPQGATLAVAVGAVIAVVATSNAVGPFVEHSPTASALNLQLYIEAFADDHVWAGRSRTEGGTWSGWHVHQGHDTYVFQTEGRLRLEFGPGGAESVECGPGDFVRIPKGVVHREGNPGTEPNEAIVVRVGEGELLVNVDGP